MQAVDAAVQLTLLVVPDPLGDRGIHGHLPAVGRDHQLVHHRAANRQTRSDQRGGDDAPTHDGHQQGQDHAVLQGLCELNKGVISQPGVYNKESVDRARKEERIQVSHAKQGAYPISLRESQRQGDQDEDQHTSAPLWLRKWAEKRKNLSKKQVFIYMIIYSPRDAYIIAHLWGNVNKKFRLSFVKCEEIVNSKKTNRETVRLGGRRRRKCSVRIYVVP